MRHLLSLFDLSTSEIRHLFSLAEQLKSDWLAGKQEPLLAGRVLGLLFEKPSLRTRVSFEAAMAQVGGSSLFLGQDVGWGEREPIRDFSRVLSSYVDAIVCRSFSARRVEELAEHSSSPVINGLTDTAHPCQALADLFTLQESRGSLDGAKLAFVGDGNNVACSLAIACGRLGVRFALATPSGYELPDSFVDRLRTEIPDVDLLLTNDSAEAVQQADAVYADVWASMGQEKQKRKRLSDFADYQISAALMREAPSEAIFMHCLPAHREEEVASEVIDGPQSVIVEQAANRMHVQKAILVWLLTQTAD